MRYPSQVITDKDIISLPIRPTNIGPMYVARRERPIQVSFKWSHFISIQHIEHKTPWAAETGGQGARAPQFLGCGGKQYKMPPSF